MNMKKIISFFIVACCAMCATAAKVVWQIGVADNSGTELALHLLSIKSSWLMILVMKIVTF